MPALTGQSPTQLSYAALRTKYMDFSIPQAAVHLNGKPFSSRGGDMVVGDLSIELTSGFEASIARFRIYNVYDAESGEFRFGEIERQVAMGAALTISLGYGGKVETVFVGFVAGITFGYEPSQLPYIEVAGMDVKGVMMAGTYACQLTAASYGDAVREILRRTGYANLKAGGGILGIEVSDTPDRGDAAEAYTVEMVSESDYDFVVKAAKRFNFEFFSDRGTVYFRRAKSNSSLLMELGAGSGILSFRVEYSITGVVGAVEARAMDPGAGKLISAKGRFTNELSTDSQAKRLVSQGKKVLVDPTITSQAQADARAASLMERMSYRLGMLEADCVGIPDLVPGRFIRLSGLGAPADNTFYVTSVVHDYREDTGFRTRFVACTDRVRKGGGGI